MTEDNTDKDATASEPPRLMLDLHIKATSLEEIESIAASLDGFERLADSPVGVGIDEHSLRVRGSIKLTQAIAPASITAIYIADGFADTQNRFLDSGWKSTNFSRHSLSFSHSMPQRYSAQPAEQPAKQAPKRNWLNKLGSWFKRVFGQTG